MAKNLWQSSDSDAAPRVRPDELIRPDDQRRNFPVREAQRQLQQKERPRWALIAYVVFLAAVLAIGGIAYTTYAFSRYRGEILPGVHVDRVSLAGLTTGQARKLLDNAVYPIYQNPVRLVYRGLLFQPKAAQLDYQPDVNATVADAEQIGRQGSFVEQLLDRLPIHPDHSVPLVYKPPGRPLHDYIQALTTVRRVQQAPVNAWLTIGPGTGYHVVLEHSQPGWVLDVARTERAVRVALGALTTKTVTLAVNGVQPAITDGYALGIRDRVENFLSHPPVIAVGKRVITTTRADFGPALHFSDYVGKQQAVINMNVDPNAVSAYVARLATTFDQQPQNPKFTYNGNSVVIVTARKNGRQLVQDDATAKLLAVVKNLQPNARLHFNVVVTQPPIDVQNPASLGIDRVLGMGETSFQGAGSRRFDDIKAIAGTLDRVLIQPNQEISFNQYVGTNWDPIVYLEQERDVNGTLVPGRGGAMQQVATTFLRALYNSGLQLEERHAHVHRFGWYEPPVGYDAVVLPSANEDLRFRNTTGKYLFITVRVEPIRQELWIYVYGPKLGWKVSVDPVGKIVKQYPHGSDILKQDPSLAPGDVVHKDWAHDGADTVLERKIVYPNGAVVTDRIKSHYQPWQAVILVGSYPTPTPTPPPKKARARATGTATPAGSATPGTPAASPTAPGPTPTPTFNH
ncbi:MAG: VanW family protein [Chloroflexi bacterium]|nr:VanW family protein [Chloroflexota bacterium]